MGYKLRLFAISLFIFIILSSIVSGVNEAKGQDVQPSAELMRANDAFQKAFFAVSAAEQTGANVTDLLSRLNEAADLLAEAEIAYRVGDVSVVEAKASRVSSIASGVETDASKAESISSFASQNGFNSYTAIALFVGFYFVLMVVVAWIWVKRRYQTNA